MWYLIALLLTSCASAITVDSTYDFWIVAGQSNAAGVGTLSASRDTARTDSAFVYFRNISFVDPYWIGETTGTWKRCIDPSTITYASIIPRLAEGLASTYGKKIGIINAGIHNTALVSDDSVRSWGRRNASDIYDILFLWGRTMRFIRNAIGSLPIKGVVWYQGESECTGTTLQASYSARFDSLKKWIWADLDTVPIYIVQLASTKTAAPDDTAWSLMRQVLYDLKDKDSVIFATCSYDVDITAANVHPTTSGYDSIGKRVARTIDNHKKGINKNYPRMTGATTSGDTLILKFNTVLRPDSTFTMIDISRKGVTGTITKAVSSGMFLKILSNISPTDSIDVRYAYGGDMTYTSPILTRSRVPILPVGVFQMTPYADRVGRLVSSITKPWVKRSTTFTITGSGFGSSQSTGTIKINNTSLGSAATWNNTTIIDTIPAGQARGYYDLIITPAVGTPDTIFDGIQVIVPSIDSVVIN